ncbi:21383_t:CDS:2 [Cetraspora pellucida]|uniref:Methylenetetrahydrofolate dehydrogenase [NAD(+)] n=1 Tax=Cetraspora pellucida TaxID=1433469 RepID=A0A9N9B7Q0_9GLOM|nr:21383_t:CDS:2 [Cetraspora pellucida]
MKRPFPSFLLQRLVLKPFREEIKNSINTRGIHPKLVGFLANQDPAAFKYAEATAKTCAETGVMFELKKCNREDLEDEIVKANEDENINGIMVYYPVFGDRQDQYLQNVVDSSKDVEGLCHKYIYNMYHNIRFLDKAQTKKCIIPCTPLAIIKVLEYVGVYNPILAYGNRLHGRVITIVNRSEIVGRPLAALLANDGGKAYSVDINGVQEFNRGTGLRLKKHEVIDTNLKLEDVIPISDVVITGVPSPSYKIPTSLLRDGVVAINFSTYKNFEDNVKEKASIYVPTIDDGPKTNLRSKSNKITKSDLPRRGCLISGSRRNEKIRVHFADEVVNNEKASRNPATKHHVAQNSNITYYM